VRLRPSPTLGGNPALELACIGHEESVEEGATIEGGRAFGVAGAQGRGVIGQVALQNLRVQAQARDAKEEGVAPKLTSKCGECVVEGVASPLGVRLWPQVRHEPVAAYG
jgi:hypothetical protein